MAEVCILLNAALGFICYVAVFVAVICDCGVVSGVVVAFLL